MSLFEQILIARGLDSESKRQDFLNPSYDNMKHDPFLLPDMKEAVDRLLVALEKQQKIVIYGDYDIDGLSATALLIDAFSSFGFQKVDAFIPNRFVEGYGMTIEAIDKVKKMGAELIVTVDCGSLCHAEIQYALDCGIETIVTDHHNVAPTRPPSVATVNPKFADSKYPFRDLCGAGVAFKLVQALQTKLDTLPDGYEKWLLDLVALGTVCDVVQLEDENRANVFWGLEVLKKQRRVGLKALMAVSNISPDNLSARSLGFGLGPRMNAAGRLETAQFSLDMLMAKDKTEALEISQKLDDFNQERRKIQEVIFAEACKQADEMQEDRVLVVHAAEWSHGVIGIVAAKLLEKYQKPTFIISERGKEATGSARSFGDFSAADAVRSADDLILRGGGHSAAAGVTLLTTKIADFRQRVNQFYDSLNLKNQLDYLLPKVDIELDDFQNIDQELVKNIAGMEPFGQGNPEPIFKIKRAEVVDVNKMGDQKQHLKITLLDELNNQYKMVAFNAKEEYFCEIGDFVAVWFQPTLNEWRGFVNVEGRLLHLARSEK